MADRMYIRDGRAPIPLREVTSRTMSAIRAKNTKPEIVLRKALFKSGLRGYRIHRADLPGRPDISYLKKKLAIFVNGCFWHRCPYCKPALPKSHKDFWREKFRKNKNRDKRKIAILKKEGWKTFVFWECQIEKDVDAYLKLISRVSLKCGDKMCLTRKG